jgi:alcohol dehydrogenase, propanol-preferring
MKSYSVVEFGEPLQIRTADQPKPQGTEVVLRVRATGVCHTDLRIHEGGYDLGGGRRLSFKERGIKLPLTLGHETVGEVIAAGPEAKGVKAGDTRAAHSSDGA